MKNWSDCISYRRFGYESSSASGMRSEFTRDYDRIIFLSAFRRLQNKTQVFPLPGNVFLHNRLTHSLEVASVGRSLGTLVGHALAGHPEFELREREQNFYRYELSGVVASACLAHDVGNPAFGHSGEKAIANYFVKNAGKALNTSILRDHFSETEWSDLTNFEGNANAFRLLTRQFQGKLQGGQRLTFLTIASILKYPCASHEMDIHRQHLKKYGYFQSDKEAFYEVIKEFDLKIPDGGTKRHPFVYLVEAADDICYRVIDMEDAHRIGILSREFVEDAFLSLLGQLDANLTRTKEILASIGDQNEAISYLRAKCINSLVQASSDIFLANQEDILSGNFNSTLMHEVELSCDYLHKMNEISVQRIYNHLSVIEVELAGYHVMEELLSVFVEATLTAHRSSLQKKCLLLVPAQYNMAFEDTTPYEKVMGVLDFVSGMTDGYATELYRKMKGIDIAVHK
jgi:dGTPase